MTAETLCILLRRRRVRLRPEVHHPGQRPAARLDVRSPRPVAGLALHPAVPEGAARIVRLRMLAVEQVRDRRRIVAAETGIGALRAVGRCRDGTDGSRQDYQRDDQDGQRSHQAAYW